MAYRKFNLTLVVLSIKMLHIAPKQTICECVRELQDRVGVLENHCVVHSILLHQEHSIKHKIWFKLYLIGLTI